MTIVTLSAAAETRIPETARATEVDGEDLPTLLVEDEAGGSASQDVARVGVRPAHAVSGTSRNATNMAPALLDDFELTIWS